MLKHLFVTTLVSLFLVSGFATDVVQAELPAKLRVGDTELVLNGWGARHKYFMQMYVSGLYLTEKSSAPDEIIAADEPMAIRLQITSGFVSQEKLVNSLQEGFQNATDGNVRPIQPAIDQFRACFRDKITKGDLFEIVYLPDRGVIVVKNGKPRGTVPGLAFKKALFGIWLCDNPADADLRQAMLARR